MIQNIKSHFSRLPKAIQRCLKVLAVFGIVCLLVPFLEVVWVRFVDPSTTMPIMLRDAESTVIGLKRSPTQHRWVSYEQVANHFFRQVVLTEDARFHRHFGFDWREIVIALEEAGHSGKPLRGASTITQQTARSVFLWQSRSWIRKGLEAYYTIWMEIILSKKRILELYANSVELGDGIYGVAAAAEHYYKKPARQLSRVECASLVAILPQPRRVNPLYPTEKVKLRVVTILSRLRRSDGNPRTQHTETEKCQTCEKVLAYCSDEIRRWFFSERAKDFTLHASTGYRDAEGQAAAFKGGASLAVYGKSPHNYLPSRAVDVWFSVDGQAVFDSPKVREMADRAPSNLEWGGNWTNIVDGPHFEERDWKTLVTDFPNGN